LTPSPTGIKVRLGVLDSSQRQELLRVARAALSQHLRGERSSDPESAPAIPSVGAFVSLHNVSAQGRKLRGCLGMWDDRHSLQHAVARMAVAAGTRDPRFEPVTVDELDDLEIEISVLSPMHALPSPEDLRPGVHGVHVSRGERRGLLLPQVAVEHGWDREEFLSQACLKAGLEPDAWRHRDTRVEVFSADVFRDR